MCRLVRWLCEASCCSACVTIQLHVCVGCEWTGGQDVVDINGVVSQQDLEEAHNFWNLSRPARSGVDSTQTRGKVGRFGADSDSTFDLNFGQIWLDSGMSSRFDRFWGKLGQHRPSSAQMWSSSAIFGPGDARHWSPTLVGLASTTSGPDFLPTFLFCTILDRIRPMGARFRQPLPDLDQEVAGLDRVWAGFAPISVESSPTSVEVGPCSPTSGSNRCTPAQNGRHGPHLGRARRRWPT